MKLLLLLALRVGSSACADTVAQPENWAQMETALEQQGVPYAEYFARVAVVESGWDFSYGVGAYNNPFGMRSRPGYASTANGYTLYPSRTAAIADLGIWVVQNPPRPAETAEAYLRRRGWNPFPGYYAYLDQVRPRQYALAQAAHALRTALGADAPALWPSLAAVAAVPTYATADTCPPAPAATPAPAWRPTPPPIAVLYALDRPALATHTDIPADGLRPAGPRPRRPNMAAWLFAGAVQAPRSRPAQARVAQRQARTMRLAQGVA